MSTKAFSSAGSKISISSAQPATDTEAGFVALTYTKIGDVTNIGAIGPETAEIAHNPVDENVTYYVKGSRTNGSLQLQGARSPSDAGQALLIAGEAAQTPVSLKIELQDGTALYASGIVLSYKTNIGGQGQITSFESNVRISGALFEVAAA
jgi:hypothetical protein